MNFYWEILARVHEKTDGRCHLCGSDFAMEDYRERWEVDHSNPKSLGGTNHLNNLFAACISCNRGKGNRESRGVLAWHGLHRSPLSKRKRSKNLIQKVVLCSTGAGLVGMAIHPKGFWRGVLMGAILGLAISEYKESGLRH